MKHSTIFRGVVLALAASGCQAVIGLSDYSQGGSGTSNNGLQPPPPAGSPGSEGGVPPSDGGFAIDAGPSCAANECLGNDGNCYGPCQQGTCSSVMMGTCSSPSAGGVYCCEPSGPPANGCDQSCQDNFVSLAVDDSISLLYNANLAGHPSGSQNKTASCPNGGSVTITGSDSVSQVNGGQIVDVMLDFSMSSCGVSNSFGSTGTSYSMTYTGSVSWRGSFPSTGTPGSNAVTYSSSNLSISGSVTLSTGSTNVSEDCPLTLTDTSSTTGSGGVSGNICGRMVSF